MPFQKGHKLSTGRPKGASNKELSRAKKILNQIIFNKQQIIEDFNNLDVKGRMEFRCRMAKFVIPEQKAIEVDSKEQFTILPEHIQTILETPENNLPRSIPYLYQIYRLRCKTSVVAIDHRNYKQVMRGTLLHSINFFTHYSLSTLLYHEILRRDALAICYKKIRPSKTSRRNRRR